MLMKSDEVEEEDEQWKSDEGAWMPDSPGTCSRIA